MQDLWKPGLHPGSQACREDDDVDFWSRQHLLYDQLLGSFDRRIDVFGATAGLLCELIDDIPPRIGTHFCYSPEFLGNFGISRLDLLIFVVFKRWPNDDRELATRGRNALYDL